MRRVTKRTPSMHDVVEPEDDVRAILLGRKIVGEEGITIVDEQRYLSLETERLQERAHGLVFLVLVGCFLQRRLTLVAVHALGLPTAAARVDGLSV